MKGRLIIAAHFGHRIRWLIVLYILLGIPVSAGPKPDGTVPVNGCMSPDQLTAMIDEIPDEPDPGMPARYLVKRIEWTITAPGEATVEEEVVLEILSERAKHDYGDVRIPFDADHETMTVMCAETRMADGEIIPLMEGADNELVPPDIADCGLPVNRRLRVLSFSGAETGSVIHYGLIRHIRLPEPDDAIARVILLDSILPTINQRIVIRYRDTIPVRWEEFRACPNATIQHANGWIESIWERHDVPAILREWGMPSVYSLGAG
ncbi:DUF3857 domain-containing protein, partial [bacterium]|nr:DUF3857 domain-containing protein [candidate division CSSED10-310 bacterium]